VSHGGVSFPFLASRVQSRQRHRLVSAGPVAPAHKRASLGPGLVAAPGLARSAVRVPQQSQPPAAQQGKDAPRRAEEQPHLFVHEGARQQLEKTLRRVLGQRVILAITDNRRTMITASPVDGAIEVRVHHMFLDADPFTQHALARYLRNGDRAANDLVGGFIAANQQRIRAPRAKQSLCTQGKKHDLQAIFGRLNDTYFQGMVDASVTWGRRTKGRVGQRSSIKLGTYCAERKLIRIHPVLDRSWVPRYFVEYVLFHEMLHHMIPMPVRDDGRREVHSAEFRASEQRFRHYTRALAWERAHISRLLRG
jgi:SprT-like family